MLNESDEVDLPAELLAQALEVGDAPHEPAAPPPEVILEVIPEEAPSTEVTLPLAGSVDKKTQRVAFTVGDNTSNLIETGLYNLTKDEAPALVHVGDDQTQQWLLVRLKQPEDSGQGNANG